MAVTGGCAQERLYVHTKPTYGQFIPVRLCPSSPKPLLPHGEKEEFGRPEAQNEIGNAGASQEPAPVRRGRPALAGRQGRDARAPNADETPAIPGGAGCPRAQACGRDARAPRRGGMPASLACGRDARAPRWGRMPARPGMRARRSRSQVGHDARAPSTRARRPRSQAVQGHERFQRVRNTVFESLFRSRPRRRASPHAPRTRGVGG